MKIKEPASTWPSGYGRVILDEVGSTLDEARRATRTQPVPFWLLAHRQTAARGRRGRAWVMRRGNFAATLVLPTTGGPETAALRSFVMSLALYRTLLVLTGLPEAFSLKWPNDVLAHGGKLAGILLETIGGTDQLAIGVGVNLKHAPEQSEVEPHAVRPVCLLGETGHLVMPEVFLTTLAAHYAVLEDQFATFGFAPIRAAWLTHAARLGCSIIVRLPDRTLDGIFEDVDPSGHLVLRGADRLHKIAAADIYFEER